MSMDVVIRDYRLTAAKLERAKIIQGTKSNRCESCSGKTKTHLTWNDVPAFACCKTCLKVMKAEVLLPHYVVLHSD